MTSVILYRYLTPVTRLLLASVLPALLLVSTSCSPQKRMGKQAVQQLKPPAVMVLFPEFVFKKNLNSKSIKGFTKMTENQQDSALYYSSTFIQYVNDSVFYSVLIQSMQEEMQKYGFEVFTEQQMDTFLTLKRPAYIFSLAQTTLEEEIDPVTDSDVFDDTLMYEKRFELHKVRISAWFEASRLNATDEKPVVLFSTFFTSDRLSGRFTRHPLLLDVRYKYELDEISLEDVFGLADYAGKKNASYLYDYLLNIYLQTQYPGHFNESVYWHYNRLKNNLRQAGEGRFTILENNP